jgi:putative spermidine/putrescine transport system ATP-binding protein
VLKLVGLPDHGSRYPRQLSGGQQQRVALARAMVFEPPILLMDEPLGALDKKLREHMQLEIKRLHRELGMSIIYVTHDQEEALVMSDRIAVFNLGRLEQVGTPTELYERPATRFVAEFIGESNIFPGVAGSTTDGFCTLESAGMRLRAIATRQPTAGARAVVSVRPERIALQAGDPPAGAENAIGGSVTDVVYLGRSRKYVIRTEAGQEVVSLQQARSGNEPGFEIGTRISLRWQAEDATVLPDHVQG